MTGGGGERAVGIERHDIEVAHGELLRKRAQLVIDEIEQLLRVGKDIGLRIGRIGAAVDILRGVRHGDKVHALDRQPAHNSLLAEPKHFIEAQVGFDIVLDHLGKIADLGHVFQLQQLRDHRLEQCLLRPDAPEVAVGIAVAHIVVVAVAQHLHHILAAEQTVALGLVNVQVLIGVVVIHVARHVKVDTAHGFDDLSDRVPLDDDLVIRLKADEL